MASRLTMLASGSSGNACLLQADGFGLLIDAGLGPRLLAQRLRAVGAAWDKIHAALLTHTHSDHWNERTLAQLFKLRIPLYCHPGHVRSLRECSPAFLELQAARLVRCFENGQRLRLTAGVHCRPLEVRHDSTPTFAFRFECQADLFSSAWSVGYASDLGTWDASVVAAFSDVDVLALEFNHDVPLQRASGRPPHLIARVLGDYGHLSNEQAAALLREIMRNSSPRRLQHLVQLHLSRDCNRPLLAARAAKSILDQLQSNARIHTASPEGTSPILCGQRSVAGKAAGCSVADAL